MSKPSEPRRLFLHSSPRQAKFGTCQSRGEALGTYHYKFDDGLHVIIPDIEIDQFRDAWLESMPSVQAFADRIGRCFWVDLLALNKRYNVTLHDLLPPLLHLEYGEPPNGVKPATPFTRHPLRGLWHKHWFSARFLADNLLAAAQRKDSMDWIWKIANEGDLLTEEIINQIAHRMTTGAFEERYAAKQMTGEWIIFLPRDGLNYYLCLGTHATGDDRLCDKIKTICALDYPDVTKWIEAAASEPVSHAAKSRIGP